MNINRYAIIIAQEVRGKSHGPKGFTRYKPYKYTYSYNRHPIVYAKIVEGDKKEAISDALKANSEMTGIAIGQTGSNYTKSWSIVLHDIIHDQPIALREGDSLSEKGYLYDGIYSSNELLKKWKIVS